MQRGPRARRPCRSGTDSWPQPAGCWRGKPRDDWRVRCCTRPFPEVGEGHPAPAAKTPGTHRETIRHGGQATPRRASLEDHLRSVPPCCRMMGGPEGASIRKLSAGQLSGHRMDHRDSSSSAAESDGKIEGSRAASIDFPEPGGPTISRLWPPAAATSSAHLALSCPLISARSGRFAVFARIAGSGRAEPGCHERDWQAR